MSAKNILFRNVWLVVFLLAILAVGGVVVGAWYLRPVTSQARGSYSIGRMTIGEKRVHEFIIPNPFPKEITLVSVKSSHPDAKVVFFDHVLPGHGQGVVRVSVHPTEPGPLQTQFSLEYRDKARGLRSVSLHGEVVPPDLPSPKMAVAPELLIEASDLMRLVELKVPGAPVVVDIRSTEDYQRSRLPGSLNMPSMELKASRHLKSQPIVIVEEGASAISALEIAKKMLVAGFSSVRVLKGGIASWRAVGAPVVGPDRDLPSLVSPISVLDGLAREGWRVVDARSTDKPLPFQASPAAVSMASLSNEIQLEDFRKGLKPSDRVLIMTDSGAGREKMRDFASKLSGVPMFFARGGAVGINREYINIVQAEMKPVVARLNATETTSNQRITRSLGGCSTCP